MFMIALVYCIEVIKFCWFRIILVNTCANVFIKHILQTHTLATFTKTRANFVKSLSGIFPRKCTDSIVLAAVESLPSPAVNLQNLRELQKSFERLRAAEVKAPKTTEEAMKKKYQFWDTQPVPKLGGFL